MVAFKFSGYTIDITGIKSKFYPNASSPLMCKSTGRMPITQPPGNDIFAFFNFAKSGPKTQKEPRIVETNL